MEIVQILFYDVAHIKQLFSYLKGDYNVDFEFEGCDNRLKMGNFTIWKFM